MGTADLPTGKRFDWERLTTALATGTPIREPGTRSEYHSGEYGYLVGEIVRRIDGRELATYFREEIAEPLAADFLISVGPEDDHRCAEIVGADDTFPISNTREWREGGDRAATGHGTADGLAPVYAALARGGELDGVRLLRPDTIDAVAQEQPLTNAVGTTGDFGLGYQLIWKSSPGLPMGTTPARRAGTSWRRHSRTRSTTGSAIVLIRRLESGCGSPVLTCRMSTTRASD